MKAIKITLAIVLLLLVNSLFAENENSAAPSTDAGTAVNVTALAPSVPSEATFEEVTSEVNIMSLAPVTPEYATFGDAAPAMVNIRELAPVTPVEADFE